MLPLSIYLERAEWLFYLISPGYFRIQQLPKYGRIKEVAPNPPSVHKGSIESALSGKVILAALSLSLSLSLSSNDPAVKSD